MKSKLTILLFIATAIGCQKNDDSQKAAPISSAASPVVSSAAAPISASVAAVASSEVSAAAVPVEEDFEQKAEATITQPTLNQELDKLEKEIGK